MTTTTTTTTHPIDDARGRSRRRSVPARMARGIALALASVSLTWVLLAWRSGAFLSSTTPAVRAGEVTADGFSSRKQLAQLPSGAVAYIDEGSGPPLVLLHGCPFSAFEWRDVIPRFSTHFRVIAPDLRGLGDTPVSLDDDYRLATDAQMVRELLDHLGIEHAAFVAHDHGGATAQLLIASDPARIERLVLTNVEAYDQWPSEPERPYLEAIVSPVLGPIMFHALQLESVRHEVFSIAVHDERVLTREVLDGWTEPHVATAARWQRLRRFFRWQLDPEHQRATVEAAPALRRFQAPVLLLWGERDTNFGPELARRLARDLPNARGIAFLDRSSHMPMQEQPEEYAETALRFLIDDQVSPDAVNELRRAQEIR
jgi:2-hydroxymuconate-semialdehyde hydrolase